MKKIITLFLSLFLIYNYSYARDVGETEITTEDGIEVFQDEKYYLLKKNVEIISDELKLNGQTVKIFFEKDLYDITEMVAKENVSFFSIEYNLEGKGENVVFNIKKQKIFISGINSELFLNRTKMFSDGEISVNNAEESFSINGNNSKLISEELKISGSKINGKFQLINGERDIVNLFVEDNNQLNIKNDDIEMIAKKAIFNKNNSTIELFDNVEIIRGTEKISGDYGILDTKKNSYKVSSVNSKKVKAILGSDE